MDKDPADTPNPKVIDALNAVYRPALTFFEQAHRQEHRFLIKYRYKKIAARFDKLVHCARCWRRHLLNRIERLGGEVDSTMGPVVVSDDIRAAYTDTLTGLRAIYAAAGDAIKVVRDDAVSDHVTHKLLMKLQAEVDRKIAKIEAHVRQTMDLGENYIITAV
jgi:bacterioferritin (cytochrome b1)